MSKNKKNKVPQTTTTTGTTGMTAWSMKNCHTGNTVVFKQPKGGTLFIGGWNMGAHFDWNTHIIDLTGSEHKFNDSPQAFDEVSAEFLPFVAQSYAGWLSLPFPDYGTPKNLKTFLQWKGITDVIQKILASGKDVLVACHGGHGRSGLFVSIVGYILHNGNDGWDSPVTKVRTIHCLEAVETFNQEQYVYDILGLDLTPDPSMYTTVSQYPVSEWEKKYIPCPICKTSSMYVGDYGMCLGCEKEYSVIAPERDNLTLTDIDNRGLVEHTCDDPKCMGIWKAAVCKHTTHNMIVYDGFCEICYKDLEDQKEFAEKKLAEKGDEWEDQEGDKCAICDKDTEYANRYGICYEHATDIITNELASQVHNSFTDPYVAIPHRCQADVQCVGIMIADVCRHVVHNREVEDGLCPDCLKEREARNGGKLL